MKLDADIAGAVLSCGDVDGWWRRRCRGAAFPTDADWSTVTARVKVGDIATGVVVGRAPYGAWVDIGVGVPALLLIVDVDGLTPERYRAGDWCLPGSEVTVSIRVTADGKLGLARP